MTYSQSNTTTTTQLWSQEQTCSDCGQGVFPLERFAICTNCGHEHALDTSNLGEGERFEFRQPPHMSTYTLHVTAYTSEEN